MRLHSAPSVRARYCSARSRLGESLDPVTRSSHSNRAAGIATVLQGVNRLRRQIVASSRDVDSDPDWYPDLRIHRQPHGVAVNPFARSSAAAIGLNSITVAASWNLYSIQTLQLDPGGRRTSCRRETRCCGWSGRRRSADRRAFADWSRASSPRPVVAANLVVLGDVQTCLRKNARPCGSFSPWSTVTVLSALPTCFESSKATTLPSPAR